MTATVIPSGELDRRRREREKQRQQRAPYVGSILDGLLDEEPDQSAPASMAQRREPTR